MGRETRCTYGGKVYIIPEIWIMGMMEGARRRGEPVTFTDVVAF